MSETKKRLTVPDLISKKRNGERAVMVAVADFLSAQWAERAGVDIVGVGDSIGMVTYGYANTLPVTLDQMIEHTKAVRRGAPNTLCLVSMPFGSYPDPSIAVQNALRLFKEAGPDVIKIQGGRDKFPIIKAIADAGVPIMSHVGLCPHSINVYGGFKTQGRTAEDAMKIIDDARAIEEAGGVGMSIEAVPPEVAQAVNDAVSVFTFSFGSGPSACGHALNCADLIGAFDTFKPKFSKRYGNVNEVATDAISKFVAEVRDGLFPDEDHSYQMANGESERLAQALAHSTS